jgi:hypothetical protein
MVKTGKNHQPQELESSAFARPYIKTYQNYPKLVRLISNSFHWLQVHCQFHSGFAKTLDLHPQQLWKAAANVPALCISDFARHGTNI